MSTNSADDKSWLDGIPILEFQLPSTPTSKFFAARLSATG